MCSRYEKAFPYICRCSIELFSVQVCNDMERKKNSKKKKKLNQKYIEWVRRNFTMDNVSAIYDEFYHISFSLLPLIHTNLDHKFSSMYTFFMNHRDLLRSIQCQKEICFRSVVWSTSQRSRETLIREKFNLITY